MLGIVIMSLEHTESFYSLWWAECQFGREAAIIETSLAISLPLLVVCWRLQQQVIPSNISVKFIILVKAKIGTAVIPLISLLGCGTHPPPPTKKKNLSHVLSVVLNYS